MSAKTGFESIIGHGETIEKLKSAAATGRLSHAYCIAGEPGVGKNYLARRFAMAIQCEKRTGDACMECPSCKKAMSGNHPDIIFIRHEKAGSIGVDEIREQLVNDIEIKPYESEHKVYIIPEAQLLTPQAQNAMLKTLEEPPEYGCIMLVTDNKELLLPTISSRCSFINVEAISEEQTYKYLKDELLIPEGEARLQAAFAQGNIGRARKLASAGDFMEKLQESLRYLKRSKELDSAARIELDKKIALDKQGIYDYLDIFEMWFRDVLYYKASRDADRVVFKNEVKALEERAQVSSYEGIQTIIDSIRSARARLKANVTPELVLELLFLTIWEN